MPLAQPLAELRRDLEAQIRKNELPNALQDLLTLLPENSEKHRIVSALIARLNAANKERFRKNISMDEYLRYVAHLRTDFSNLTAALVEADFDAPVSAKASMGKVAKQGSVLYRVPHVMSIQKPTLCTVRVAISEEAILENIVLDEHVQVKSHVEVSDVMSAELVDPEGGTFQISPLNSRTQLVRDVGYTEWNFSVTPLREGVHQLLVKVSIMEKVMGFTEPVLRDISVMETITIVTENLAPADTDDVPLQSAGETFAFQFVSLADYGFEVVDTKSDQSSPRRRIFVIFLTSLVLVLAVTWLSMPAPTRDWYVARVRDNAATYQAYIDEHKDQVAAEKYVEKATFRKAMKTERPGDYLTYLEKYKENGQYQMESRQALKDLETKQLQVIRENPTLSTVRQFLADFPESEGLSEIKQAVETRPEVAAEVLPELETAYVYAVQEDPRPQRVRQFLTDFPESQKLDEVAKTVMANPALAREVQPELEDVYLKKMEVNPTKPQVEAFLQNFPVPVHKEKLEQILEKNPQLKKEFMPKIKKAEEEEKAEAERLRAEQDALGKTQDAVEQANFQELQLHAQEEDNKHARLEKETVQETEGVRQQKEAKSNNQGVVYAPTLNLTAVNNLTQTSATLDGVVNPNGASTDAWFETPTSKQKLHFQNIGSGNSPVTLTPYILKGLPPGTTYSFRVIASNSVSITTGNWVSFTTPSIVYSSPSIYPPPTATNITQTSAILNGVVNPNGANTNAWFKTPISEDQLTFQNIGSGNSPVTLAVFTCTGLTPGTTYRFGVSAKNSSGYSTSPWISFTTLKVEHLHRSGFDMVPVEGGTYTMGDGSDSSQNNCAHSVTVGSFSIGMYEVTQADWREVMGEDPLHVKMNNIKGCDECPVEFADDIRGFIKKLNAKTGQQYRLPTEEEWEYAARGGIKSKGYMYAGDNNPDKVGWYYTSGNKSYPVGEKIPNELGLYDMSGNVWEMCQHTWKPYPCDKEAKANELFRVARGGSVRSNAEEVRVTFRKDNVSISGTSYGFRLAQD